jgi:hypothetical protein
MDDSDKDDHSHGYFKHRALLLETELLSYPFRASMSVLGCQMSRASGTDI